MAGTVIDGNTLAEELSEHVHEELRQLKISGARPGLATILVGDDHAAAAYERHVERLAERLECEYANEHLPDDAELADVLAVVGKLNADPRVTGILVLRPLPAGISEPLVYRALDPYKDVEAVHPENAGLLAQGRPRFVPSTPASCFYLLDAYAEVAGREPESFYPGKTLVVVGRSDSVGKPAASLGLQRHATVVTCHSRTTRSGCVHAAGGHPHRRGRRGGPRDRRDMVRDGVIAVDVGIDPVKDPETGKVRFVGDIEFDERRGQGRGHHAGPRRGRADHRCVVDRERRERCGGRAPGRAPVRRLDVTAARTFRSGDRIARVIVALLGLSSLLALVMIAFRLGEQGLLARIANLEFVSEEEVTRSDARVAAVAVVQLLTLVVTGIVWLVWQHRGQANLVAARVTGLRFTPGWAVGWWFVPFANLVKPFQAMRELWKASGGEENWGHSRTWSLIGWWWAAWLTAGVLGRIGGAVIGGATTLETVRSGSRVLLLTELVVLAAAILAIVLIRSVVDRQRRLRERIADAGHPPARPDLPEPGPPTGL